MKIVTSIRIDEELWKEAKHYAIETRMTLTQLIETALTKEIKKGTKKIPFFDDV